MLYARLLATAAAAAPHLHHTWNMRAFLHIERARYLAGAAAAAARVLVML